jgi:enoyl-[acyl-carrier protein] reductase I
MSEKTTGVSGLLQGKRGLIVGVANRNSIAWACARALADAGMELAFTYQGEAMRDRVEKTTSEIGDVPLYDMDVQSDEQIDAAFRALGDRWGEIDFLLHSVAYAPREALSNPFLQTSREAFLAAHEVSAYSLVGLTRAAAPFLREGASIVTMTFYGAEKVVPNYNVMGVAKAALEASVRYLAADLGPRGIRINAISAGAVNTLAARGVAHFRELLRITGERAAMRRPIEVEEVGNACVYLASPLSTGTTGETLYVDAGFSIMA